MSSAKACCQPKNTSEQEYNEFLLGNAPEGLNVKESQGREGMVYLSSTAECLELRQDVHQFGLAGKIWHSLDPAPPIPRSCFLDCIEPMERPYRIIELGAGTGYVGIALANMLRKECEVYITDLLQVLPLITENVSARHQAAAAHVRVERLHWGNKGDAQKLLQDGPFDVVIASDCVYFPELFPLLQDTLLDICSPQTRVVIGYKCRSLEKEVGFWQDYFGRYFEYEPVRKKDAGLFGEEDQMFVFVGSRRPCNEVKAADDTFTTILFCSMDI
ncbi:hypothetical protein EC973_008352 [Apophysomyces ossiformis]|uniref:Uncharacterized protein n=1 Tax=Apophysomyces ossiformis TaxID=679940 RepID=A0A8H7BQP8_9FUNG|nr:hypothetical protein EC973_008352 [Apophysomyces ossiformis]